MGWIGIAGGNAMAKGPKSPYTPAEYDTVLQFFQSNQGSFFAVVKIAQLNSLTEIAVQAIVDAQIADPSTGVIQQKKTYGIPKKEEKKSKK